MNNELKFLDILNIMSFAIGMQNLDENLSQGKAGDMLSVAVEDIHKHLKEQDEKIELILLKLEELSNDKNKENNKND